MKMAKILQLDAIRAYTSALPKWSQKRAKKFLEGFVGRQGRK
jgi:hypothetical protein